MADGNLDYPALVQEALRDVVRLALEQVVEDGLPGDHHLYIAFRTTDPGVQIPSSLLALHPEELTIVLQHQYWDLEVSREEFSVVLSFSGRRQRIVVPFSAMTSFADPEGPFGLKFEAPTSEPDPDPEEEPVPEHGEIEESDKVVSLDRFRKRR
ncbi:MAG: ClpXP protease specificity-enhancing factor SspB [Acidobacteriota bacterium]